MFPEEDAKKRIHLEIESVLGTHPETPEVLEIAYRGYRCLPGGAKNTPNSLFDKMLQYPSTKVYQSALFGLAAQSEDARQKWHYYQRFIDECTASDVPEVSWYLLAHEKMLWSAEEDRSLTSDDSLDELMDRFLKAHLSWCQDTQQWFGWAYTEAVTWRLKFNIRLDKALEILERAEIRLGEEEEQEWLVERNNRSVEEAHKNIARLRGEIYLRQERWRESHDELAANAPDFLGSPSKRFDESAINYLYMLGRSAEGISEWEKAKRYYADAHFAPTPHADARAGLERVYHQMQRGATDTFEAFLKDTETEYRAREDADREKIRQNFIANRLNKKATDFRLETLEGETCTLSAMRGKVILLDVGASWCGPCNMAIPEVKIVYEQFREVDDVVVWGINSGEAPHQVRKFLNQHQPPWPILLDPHREVGNAYQIETIPFFILIDKAGNWQYSFKGSHLINGQPLIWLIEALLAD
jgi:peroxiredoxin